MSGRMYVVSWEFVDPVVAMTAAVLDAKPPFYPVFETNVRSVAERRHAELDIQLLSWVKSLGFDPNGTVRTWCECCDA